MTIQTLQSYVGGIWRSGSLASEDINPAHPDEVVAQVQLADEHVTVGAVEAARHAFLGWRSMPPPARGNILRKAADLLEQRSEGVARDLTREEGKALFEAIGEITRAVAILRYYAGQTTEPDGETYPSANPLTLLYARREPVGVTVAITPYNFPIAIPAWKIAPALAYGNTVIWKPAETVPLTASHFLRALVDAGMPDGVINLILGKGSEVGRVLTRHQAVDAITFTGSNLVGRAIQLEATANGKKVQLEMGGKNPAVVLKDADLDLAVEHVARAAFYSAGQKCTATSRVIVEAPIAREFGERLASIARTWKMGDPLEKDTKIGPLVSQDQMQTVLGYLQVAREDRATVLAGGEQATELGNGYYVQPTVLTDLSPESRVVLEEIFGPVATLLPASSYKEAIALANDTPFGLSASLFTRDLGTTLRFVQDIRAGVVKINQESAGLEYQVPFGGMKGSSSGSREQGRAAKEFFTQWKTVYMDMPPMEES